MSESVLTKKENKMNTTKQYRIIIIPPNSYDTVKTLSYKTEKERKQWFKCHANNPTISNCQIILEEGKHETVK